MKGGIRVKKNKPYVIYAINWLFFHITMIPNTVFSSRFHVLIKLLIDLKSLF